MLAVLILSYKHQIYIIFVVSQQRKVAQLGDDMVSVITVNIIHAADIDILLEIVKK